METTKKVIGTREVHYMENQFSGMVVTESAKGAVIVPVVDVRDGPAYRRRALQIERQGNGNTSQYFSNNDRLKFPRRKYGKITYPVV
jgi:hypothetical protein